MSWKPHPSKTDIILSERDIKKIVQRLAKEIERDYEKKDLVVIGVLKGAAFFMSDLVRQINLPLTVDFVRVSSYRADGTLGDLRLEFDHTQPIQDKDVLVLEDVVDTGKTLNFIEKHLSGKGANSIKFGALLRKEHTPGGVQVHYLGKVIPSDYVVGYGMDLGGLYRNLPWIERRSLTKS